MSDESFVVPSKYKYVFAPGTAVLARDFSRFEPYLARQNEETDAAYAARLDRAGLAVVVTSEGVRDMVTYRARIDEAKARGVPLAHLTVAPLGPPPFDEAAREAQKAAALAAARASQS